MNYFKHLWMNWRVAGHALTDFFAHFIHGLIPCIKIKHHQPVRSVIKQRCKMDSDREFEEIIANYISEDICPQQYRQKPYYEIKYKQYGKSCVGFGTFKPEVLSKNIREHFMANTGRWIKSNIPNEKYVCSECGGGCWYYDYQASVAKSRYCPNCGAKMKSKGKE